MKITCNIVERTAALQEAVAKIAALEARLDAANL